MLGEIKKELENDARKRIPSTMDSTKECGSYQRPRQTRETESRRARTKIKLRLGIIESLNGLIFEVSIGEVRAECVALLALEPSARLFRPLYLVICPVVWDVTSESPERAISAPCKSPACGVPERMHGNEVPIGLFTSTRGHRSETISRFEVKTFSTVLPELHNGRVPIISHSLNLKGVKPQIGKN